jgi:hypothetical protein
MRIHAEASPVARKKPSFIDPKFEFIFNCKTFEFLVIKNLHLDLDSPKTQIRFRIRNTSPYPPPPPPQKYLGERAKFGLFRCRYLLTFSPYLIPFFWNEGKVVMVLAATAPYPSPPHRNKGTSLPSLGSIVAEISWLFPFI